ncbi:hypothetical protein BKE38_12690 [Pseudoroseomonas deserti]|uniref:Uncharacterized protein n=1 Tax=Teichococcus deserti TaxID=1817963 RepID=A0A1V2H4A6_9PROT|nr:hypothetical protein [Pseudoroseomonas deserti]ONG53235.1 hypothetical protein BKE38_12690 [Pseudoroseomonas deserti]
MTIDRPIDQDTLYRMREIIRIRLTMEGRTIEVACAEARGFGGARHPNALAEIEAAITSILQDLGALEPAPPTASGKDGVTMVAVEWSALTEALSYAMRFDERGKRRSTASEFMAAMAAGEMTRRIEATGFVLMRRPRQVEDVPWKYDVPGVSNRVK